MHSSAFPLVDVAIIDDNDIMNHRRMAALTLLMTARYDAAARQPATGHGGVGKALRKVSSLVNNVG